MTKEADLRFSGIVLGPAGGTSTVAYAGNNVSTQTFSAGLYHHDFDTWSVACLQVHGTQSRTYAVSTPSTTTIYNGTSQMTVDIALPQYESGSRAFRLKADGTQRIYIGGTLHVVAGQATGFYYGTFIVSVAYN